MGETRVSQNPKLTPSIRVQAQFRYSHSQLRWLASQPAQHHPFLLNHYFPSFATTGCDTFIPSILLVLVRVPHKCLYYCGGNTPLFQTDHRGQNGKISKSHGQPSAPKIIQNHMGISLTEPPHIRRPSPLNVA